MIHVIPSRYPGKAVEKGTAKDCSDLTLIKNRKSNRPPGCHHIMGVKLPYQ